MSDPNPVSVVPCGLRPLRLPLAPQARPLRLYPGTAGELRVYWRLTADLLIPYRAYFPAADGPLTLVLRLLHLAAEGAPAIFGERHLNPRALDQAGETSFPVHDDPGPFQAELGLINPQHGWLLLCRSNQLLHACAIGLEGLRPPPADLESEEAAGSMPGLPDPGKLGALWDQGLLSEPPQPTGPEISAQCPALGQGSAPNPGYGLTAPATQGLVIEAELRLQGWGPPHAKIDLFGHPYRLGPGGRFQLRIRIDDPEIIRQILARHPPPGGWL